MAKALVPTPNTGDSTESDFTFWGELTVLLYMVFGTPAPPPPPTLFNIPKTRTRPYKAYGPKYLYFAFLKPYISTRAQRVVDL